MPEYLDSKILDIIDSELTQSQIINALKGVANKNTVIKHLKRLVGDKSIRRHKRGKYVTYAPTDFDNEADLDRSLRKNLDAIDKIMEKTKNEMPGYYHETKTSLNDYFESEYHAIDRRIQHAVYSESAMRKSIYPYLRTSFGEIRSGLARLKKSNLCSDDHLKMLRNVIEEISRRSHKIDDDTVEFYKQLDSATDRRSRDAIRGKIHDGSREGLRIEKDLEKICNYVKIWKEPLDDFVERMYETYLKEKPDVAAEIATLLSERDRLHQSVLWRILHNTAGEVEQANRMKLLRHNDMASRTDADGIGLIREEMSGWTKRAEEAETQLDELKAWLVQ